MRGIIVLGLLLLGCLSLENVNTGPSGFASPVVGNSEMHPYIKWIEFEQTPNRYSAEEQLRQRQTLLTNLSRENTTEMQVMSILIGAEMNFINSELLLIEIQEEMEKLGNFSCAEKDEFEKLSEKLTDARKGVMFSALKLEFVLSEYGDIELEKKRVSSALAQVKSTGEGIRRTQTILDTEIKGCS